MENEKIELVKKRRDPKDGPDWSLAQEYGRKKAEEAIRFHRSFSEYTKTPLCSLSNLAQETGVASILVKDESKRFGLNAFKVLGGSLAIGKYLSEKFDLSFEEVDYPFLRSREVQKACKELTFVTATDGNHGRGVAWTASRLGCKSVIYMPKGTAKERLENIRKLGADASITDLNYDDAVRKAEADAKKNGWVVVQDTSWEGYDRIPGWIMQGYTTMGMEIVEQMEQEDLPAPTHIFLQAGVGAMAGAMTAFFADVWQGKDKPTIVIVEPNAADCIFRTAKADDHTLHTVTGDLNTIMAGLACGEPCSRGWRMLDEFADFFVSMPDSVAANGMRILANPVGTDERIVSGESGAAGFGYVMEVLKNPDLRRQKELLGLGDSSRILCISTEGDTDQENYRKIVFGL